MEEQHNDNIEQLLPLYCEGLVDEATRKKVEEWMQESEEHRRIARQIEMLYLATDTLQVMDRVDTDKALCKVKGKLIVKKRKVWWGRMQRAAAILFLPVLTALLIEYFGSPHESVRMMEARTSPGMTAKVVLPDSTVVCLNSDTRLVYPSSFAGDDFRKVELEGEAYFEVQKNADQQFIVNTPHAAQVKVFGTSFNVEAYADMKQMAVTLVEGKVGFDYSAGNKMKEVILSPNQKVIYNSESGTIERHLTSCLTETAWKDGKIILRNTPAKEVLHILEKRYNVKFIVASNIQLTGSFTGTFSDQHLERILEYFKLSVGLRWKYVDGEDISQSRIHIMIY